MVKLFSGPDLGAAVLNHVSANANAHPPKIVFVYFYTKFFERYFEM